MSSASLIHTGRSATTKGYEPNGRMPGHGLRTNVRWSASLAEADDPDMQRYAIGAALALTLALGACGSSSKKASTSPTTAAATSDSSAPAAAAASGTTVSVATGPDGQYLVGPNGNTLYLFEKDQGTTTACTGPCVSNWPGLAASGTPSAGSGIDMAKLSTADGEVPNQVVYNGHLLYFFAGDKKPGDITGTKIPNWYPVFPDGNKIDKD